LSEPLCPCAQLPLSCSFALFARREGSHASFIERGCVHYGVAPRWAWTQLHSQRGTPARKSVEAASLPLPLYFLLVGWLVLWRALEMGALLLVFTEAVDAATADEAPAWEPQVLALSFPGDAERSLGGVGLSAPSRPLPSPSTSEYQLQKTREL
jgi:hypothetical protein